VIFDFDFAFLYPLGFRN